MRFTGARELTAKRALGWLSWRLRRRHRYLPAVAERVIADLRAQAPDHVAVTGDLTHMGLAAEVREAVDWLARVGPPEQVMLVPGNHDAYAADLAHAGMDAWTPYFDSDPDRAGAAPFPSVRVRGPVALVGVSSACRTAVHLATGRLGGAQRERLAELLAELGARGLFRVLLVHHPPDETGVSWRRRLEDGAELRAVLARVGAELVLHGHVHRACAGSVPGPRGGIPVRGVPAASASGRHPGGYQVFTIAPRTRGFDVACERRELDLGTGLVRTRGVETL